MRRVCPRFNTPEGCPWGRKCHLRHIEEEYEYEELPWYETGKKYSANISVQSSYRNGIGNRNRQNPQNQRYERNSRITKNRKNNSDRNWNRAYRNHDPYFISREMREKLKKTGKVTKFAYVHERYESMKKRLEKRGYESESNALSSDRWGRNYGGNRVNNYTTPTNLNPVMVRRLMRDLRELEKNPLPTITARPLRRDITKWHCNIIGNIQPWKGIVIHLVLEFPQNYPKSSPRCILKTSITHSHVFRGTICLDLLETIRKTSRYYGWSSAYSVQSILLQLQNFLFDDTSGYRVLTEKDVKEQIRKANVFCCRECAHNMSKNQMWPCTKEMIETRKSIHGIPKYVMMRERKLYFEGVRMKKWNPGATFTKSLDTLRKEFGMEKEFSRRRNTRRNTDRNGMNGNNRFFLGEGDESIVSELFSCEKKMSIKKKKEERRKIPAQEETSEKQEEEEVKEVKQKKRNKKKKKKKKKNKRKLKKIPKKSRLMRLPTEIIKYHILPYLPKLDLLRMQRVSKEFHDMCFCTSSLEKTNLLCFHSKRRYVTKQEFHSPVLSTLVISKMDRKHHGRNIILGYGVNIRRNPYDRNNSVAYVEVPCLDYISYYSYVVESVRSSVWNRGFTDFFPVYINSDHGGLAWDLFCHQMCNIYKKDVFCPYDAIDFLCKVMNTSIVSSMSGSEISCEKALQCYFHAFRLICRVFQQYPFCQGGIERRIERFLVSSSSSKFRVERNIGNFLQLVAISRKYSWDEVVLDVLEEQWERNPKWVIREYPEYELLGLGKGRREMMGWKGSMVSAKLVLFNQVFYRIMRGGGNDDTLSMAEIGVRLDGRFGQPPTDIQHKFLEELKKVKNISCFSEFFEYLGIVCVRPVSSLLVDSVANSLHRRLHRRRKFYVRRDDVVRKRKPHGTRDWSVRVDYSDEKAVYMLHRDWYGACECQPCKNHFEKTIQPLLHPDDNGKKSKGKKKEKKEMYSDFSDLSVLDGIRKKLRFVGNSSVSEFLGVERKDGSWSVWQKQGEDKGSKSISKKLETLPKLVILDKKKMKNNKKEKQVVYVEPKLISFENGCGSTERKFRFASNKRMREVIKGLNEKRINLYWGTVDQICSGKKVNDSIIKNGGKNKKNKKKRNRRKRNKKKN